MFGHKKRNYNEPNDITTELRMDYKENHPPVVEYIKTSQSALGLEELLEEENFEEVDGRKDTPLYRLKTLIMAALFTCCLGISRASAAPDVFLHRDAVANLRFLSGEDVDIWPNYQTINGAFAKADGKILAKFEKVSQKAFRKLIHSGRYPAKTKWGYHVVFDATDIAFFTERHCEHCLTATYNKGTKNEKTYYFHKMLVARVYLAPSLSIVLGAEPIANDTMNPSKQDCENKAAVKLMDRIKDAFPGMDFLISGDALYANKTFIRKCICYHWNYLFTLKRGVQPTLCDEFDKLKEQGYLDSAEISYDEETGTIYWSNKMEIILGSKLPMNVLQYKTEKMVKKGEKRAVDKEFTNKEYKMDMPELSKDHEKYDLDERENQQRKDKVAKKAQEIDKKSDEVKEKMAGINKEEAAALDDANVEVKTQESDNLKNGDVVTVTFMYITNIEITSKNVCQLLLLGRERWAIEEDFLRQKAGRIDTEHLRTRDENGMYIYFWVDQFADLMMQLYLYHTEVLKYARTQERVYDWLKDSFMHVSLEQSESLSARTCLWKRNNTHKEHKASLISYTPVHTATCENREKNETHSTIGQVKYAKKQQTPTPRQADNSKETAATVKESVTTAMPSDCVEGEPTKQTISVLHNDQESADP